MIRRGMLGMSLLLLLSLPVTARADRVLRAEVVVKGPLEEVWKAWTTGAGMQTFFAPACKVDLRVDGTYDVWFNSAGGPGERGAEGMRILDVEPMSRFAFTWNAPPSIPKIRGKLSLVVVDFAAEGETATRLRFTHLGWGEGPGWDKAYDYFDKAWGAVVLPRLLHRFEHGPLDWSKPPEVKPLPSMKRELAGKAR